MSPHTHIHTHTHTHIHILCTYYKHTYTSYVLSSVGDIWGYLKGRELGTMQTAMYLHTRTHTHTHTHTNIISFYNHIYMYMYYLQ